MAISKIKTDSIADAAITSDKIATGGISTADLADGAITSDKIANDAISTAALVNGAVTDTKLATGSVENYFGTQGFALGMRNRIINGDMRIDQRNAGAAVAIGSVSSYNIDRWVNRGPTSPSSTIQRSSDAPSGFTNSILVTVGTGATPSTTQDNHVRQLIEGFNIADLGWGTASAKTVTVSFWVRCSLTGTFGGSLRNNGSSRSYPFTYSISAVNTWEHKTITIPGDTSGTWLTDNGIGLVVTFSLGTGATYLGPAGAWAGTDYRGATGETNVVATTGATFQITGVQLEAGSVATPFERRPFGTELALCQRYFQKSYNLETAVGSVTNTGVIALLPNNSTFGEVLQVRFPVAMRASPTGVSYNPSTGSSGSIRNVTSSSSVSADLVGLAQNGFTNLNTALTSGSVYTLHYTMSSEL